MSRKILLRRRKFHEKITHTALEILVFFCSGGGECTPPSHHQRKVNILITFCFQGEVPLAPKKYPVPVARLKYSKYRNTHSAHCDKPVSS